MFEKILFLLVLGIFIHANPAYSQNFVSYSSPYNNQINDCTDYPAISGIERNIFGCTFQYQNIYQRVNRLEKATLGATFPQEALCDRIDRISKATSGGNYAAYSNPSTQQYINQSPLNYNWQSMLNGFNDNSSYNNQYYNASQNASGLQKMLDIALPVISSFIGNNYGYNNDPRYIENYNSFRNSNCGVGVRILP